jgi:hypothetical protein
VRDMDSIVAALERDAEGGAPKFPPVAFHLLKDEKLRTRLQERFEGGQELLDITSLGYSFRTGLQAVVFEFSASRFEPSILVLSGFDCNIVGLVDPFDKERPNPKIPPLPPSPTLPFALARPTRPDDNISRLGLPGLMPSEIRSQQFFEALQLAQLQASGTKCTYETSRYRYCSIWTGIDPYLPGTVCDEYDERVATDTVVDDC